MKRSTFGAVVAVVMVCATQLHAQNRMLTLRGQILDSRGILPSKSLAPMSWSLDGSSLSSALIQTPADVPLVCEAEKLHGITVGKIGGAALKRKKDTWIPEDHRYDHPHPQPREGE